MKTRTDAYNLLVQYTISESLIKHALAVECALNWYAAHFAIPDAEKEKWSICGLLHDFDYEKFPEPFDAEKKPLGHPFYGVNLLRTQGYDEEICQAILGHAQYTGVARETLLSKVLFACDELCGLVTASVYVRPDRSIGSLELKSVVKRYKEKQFARGCNREDIEQGSKELGLPLEDHMGNVLKAMQAQSESLGLAGVQAVKTAA